MVKQYIKNDYKSKIDLSNLSNGFYWLEISLTNGIKIYKKVIKI